MSTAIAEAMKIIVSMSREEKVELLERLQDEVWTEVPVKDLADLKAELDRRWAGHVAHPNDVVTWEEVVAHVRRPR